MATHFKDFTITYYCFFCKRAVIMSRRALYKQAPIDCKCQKNGRLIVTKNKGKTFSKDHFWKWQKISWQRMSSFRWDCMKRKFSKEKKKNFTEDFRFKFWTVRPWELLTDWNKETSGKSSHFWVAYRDVNLQFFVCVKTKWTNTTSRK